MDLYSISEIEPGLFIGDVQITYDRAALLENHITAVVSLVNDSLDLWKLSGFTDIISPDRHLWIECIDSSTQDLLVHMRRVSDFIDQMLRTPTRSRGDDLGHHAAGASEQPMTGGNVLVHCNKGRSRAPTVVIAYLMRKYGQSPEEALVQVRAKRRIRPSGNFMTQLAVWEQVKYQIWEDEAQTMPKRQYREFLELREKRLKEKEHERRLIERLLTISTSI